MVSSRNWCRRNSRSARPPGMGERCEALVRGELGRGGGELATGSCLRHPGCTRRRLLASEAVGTPDALSVAIVGYGLAGSVFHAPLVTATPGLRLASVLTGDAGRADAARSAYPGGRILGDADGVFAAPDVTDLVVIAAPNVAHVPLARRAVAAGLPVVVDKPFAVDPVEAAAVLREAEAAGVLLTVFHNRRHDGDFRTVRALLEGAALGRLV